MVGFEHEHVGGADAVNHEFGYVAEVGDETDTRAVGAQHKSDGVLGVVRDGKGFDEEVVEFEAVAGAEQTPIEAGVSLALSPGARFSSGEEREITMFTVALIEAIEHGSFVVVPFAFESPKSGFLGGAIAVDRKFQFVRKREQTGDVVGVFVRDEDAGEILGRATDRGEALANLAGAEARVHEDAGFVGFHIGAIATGTAAEDGEPNGHRGDYELKVQN